MMHSYFPFGFPYYRPKYSYYNNYASKSVLHNSGAQVHKNSYNAYSPNNFSKNLLPKSVEEPICDKTIPNFNNTKNDDCFYNSDECFEIFGFKLHFDDILILFLLFFLYKEEVTDSYLYIALVLLLLG